MINENATIGDKIKFIRELRGYKQDFIATQLGISQNGYGKIERGETDVPYSRLEQISEVLNISVEDLVSLNKEKAVCAITNNNSQITHQFIHQSTINDKVDISMLLERLFLLEERVRKLEK